MAAKIGGDAELIDSDSISFQSICDELRNLDVKKDDCKMAKEFLSQAEVSAILKGEDIECKDYPSENDIEQDEAKPPPYSTNCAKLRPASSHSTGMDGWRPATKS